MLFDAEWLQIAHACSTTRMFQLLQYGKLSKTQFHQLLNGIIHTWDALQQLNNAEASLHDQLELHMGELAA